MIWWYILSLLLNLAPFSLPELARCVAMSNAAILGSVNSCTVHRRVVFSSHGDLNRVQRALQATTESLFSVLFPSDCRICQLPLTQISNLPVCRECLDRMVPLAGILCTVCGEKLYGHYFQSDSGPLCGLCRQAPPQFRRAAAYGPYEGALRDLIHLLKYDGIRSAARVLGKLLNAALVDESLTDFRVVPVPLAKSKRRARGFNQAEEIAWAFFRERADSSIQMDTGLLVRTRETISQTGLTREQRKANLRGAFAVANRAKAQGRRFLLVDDVMTTGATADECSRALLRAGAKEVFVATVARATRETEGVLAQSAGALAGGTTGHARA